MEYWSVGSLEELIHFYNNLNNLVALAQVTKDKRTGIMEYKRKSNTIFLTSNLPF